MPYSIRLPNGEQVSNIPDSLDPKEAARQIAQKMPWLTANV